MSGTTASRSGRRIRPRRPANRRRRWQPGHLAVYAGLLVLVLVRLALFLVAAVRPVVRCAAAASVILLLVTGAFVVYY